MSDRSVIAAAADALLSTLDDGQRHAVSFELSDERERSDWDYRPRTRPGLAIGSMRPDQQVLLHKLIGTACSAAGQMRVSAIMALEPLLDRLEPWRGDRDASTYALSVFGSPSDPAWAFRFEGHHVSLHVTIADTGMRAVPSFLGANPAAVRGSHGFVSRPLAEEEDLARSVLWSLADRERSRAVISDLAPYDLLHENAPSIEPVEPIGVPVADMTRESRGLVRSLLTAWADRLPPEIAAAELDRLEGTDGDELWFAWAGSPEAGGPWYYRVTGPRLWIEADCTQDGANHIHSVWRDPEGDFGRDVLREHLARDHGLAGLTPSA
jgi:hypothetical protein